MHELAMIVVGDNPAMTEMLSDEIKNSIPNKLLTVRPGMSLVHIVGATAKSLERALRDPDLEIGPEFAESESRLIVAVGDAANETLDRLEAALQEAREAGNIHSTDLYWPVVLRRSDALSQYCRQINLKTVALVRQAKKFRGEDRAESRLRQAGLQIYDLEYSTEHTLNSLSLDADIQLLNTQQDQMARQLREAANVLVAPHAQVLVFDGMSSQLSDVLRRAGSGRLPVIVSLQEIYLQLIRDWVLKHIESHLTRCNDAPPPTTKVVVLATLISVRG